MMEQRKLLEKVCYKQTNTKAWWDTTERVLCMSREKPQKEGLKLKNKETLRGQGSHQ